MKYNFLNQIDEDIKIIQGELVEFDANLKNENYAFNYWILSKIYNVDEEEIPNYITEYNDKNIDCFVHFEESKELFIIQNKYYDENTNLSRKEVADFLQTPISHLKNNIYKRNKELQDIFNNAVNDPEYKIWLHFYITNDKYSDEINMLFREFNKNENNSDRALIRAKYFQLKDIYEIYFGETFKDDINFDFTLNTKNKGTILRILPEQYQLQGMSEAHYIMTSITDLYKLYHEAQNKRYPIFEENIREYLGKSSINKGINDTLRNKNDRQNFFYYNNGITIICKETKKHSGNQFSLNIVKPQIVNGCQTVNTIYEVLNDYKKEEIEREFADIYVMVKVLVYNEKLKQEKPYFYKDIVKYTNRQNAINDDAFGANHELFSNLKKYFIERGFLLLANPSDKVTHKKNNATKADLLNLLSKAQKYSVTCGLELTTLNDLTIPLEKLLQIYLALFIDGHTAYKKKGLVLKLTSETYRFYSVKIQDNLSIDSMIRLYLLYKRAENDRKESEDKKTPIPYYLIGFIGYFIKEKTPTNVNRVIDYLFSISSNDFEIIFTYFKKLTNLYKLKYKTEYNVMIKKPINNEILKEQIETLDTIYSDNKVFQRFKVEVAK